MKNYYTLALLIFIWIGFLVISPSFDNKKNIATPYQLKHSWMSNNTNTVPENLDFPEPILLDSTSDLEYLRDRLACLPTNWGYSKKDGDTIFPYKKYPKCSQINSKKANISLDYNSNLLKLECLNGAKGRYVSGNKPGFKLVNRVGNEWDVHSYPGHPAKLNSEEFILASCETFGKFDIPIMRPRYNETLHKLAKENTKAHKGILKKPITIVHIACDSLSRRHFIRKLPTTVAYLNSLNENSTHKVFDFKIHNIQDHASIENQVYVYSGINYLERMKQKNPYPPDLWNLLRVYGFISLMAMDSCNEQFAPVLGRDVPVDYTINEFYCAAVKYADFADLKDDINQQRCIGQKMAHDYILDYAWELLEIYPDTNKWINMHLDAGHESTGLHAITLDEELTAFLKKILSREEEVAIILEGDHGMRYGEWWSTEEAAVEWRLPAFFFIASDSLLSKVPNSIDNLVHNTHRLTTKIHQRYLTLHLAELTTGVDFGASRNLMTAYTPDNTTCNEFSIDAWLCSCRSFEYMKDIVKNEKDYKEVMKLVDEMLIETLYFLNMQLHMTFRLKKVCKQLVLQEILEVWGVPIDKTQEMIKVHVLVEGGAKFEILWLIKSRKRALRPGSFRTDQIFYRNRKRGSQLLFVNRLDKYEGPCEDLASSLHVPAKYCMCNEELLANAALSIKE
ncbi:unnamed protein product [Blepharisma stoltei]|uniref:Uncharacterized protein n=1 Tax=Blepharisma stoltei TaxID=1481888 RepID=A0AAU9JMI8_9CILI|nr:unnamed protein product [Blepharisma stoltei]